jgi:hypothetical protein
MLVNATFLAADDEVDLVLNVVERIERGEIALARHAENGIDAVQTQAVDKDLSAGAEVRRCTVGHRLVLISLKRGARGSGANTLALHCHPGLVPGSRVLVLKTGSRHKAGVTI